MRTSDHGLAPAYNVQLASDAKHKLIVDVEVSKQPSDSHHLLPALDRIQERMGTFPQQAVADGDYTTREAVVGAAERVVDYYGSWNPIREEWIGHGIDPAYHPSAFAYEERRNEMICPEGRRLKFQCIQQRAGGLQIHVFAANREDCRKCPKRESCTPQNAMVKHGRTVSVRIEPEALTHYHRKMETEPAKAIYTQRAPVAEFPNAWLKDKLKFVRLRPAGSSKHRPKRCGPA